MTEMDCEGLRVKEINTYFHSLELTLNKWLEENQDKIIIKTDVVRQHDHGTLFLIWYRKRK
jgi:hypothetical protein